MQPRTSNSLPRRAALWIPAAAIVAVACAPAAEAPPAGVQPAPTAPLPASAIASVTMVANNTEIEESQIALQRSTNESVRQFAQRMVNDHRYLNDQLNQAMGGQQIGTQGIALSQQVQEGSRTTQQMLQGLSGPAFDQAYMQRQVEFHEWTLETIDDTLMPSATDPALRGVLETTRSTVAEHLEHARQIRSGLGQPNQGGSGHHNHD